MEVLLLRIIQKKTLEDWTIEFEFERSITSVWNGEIKSSEGNHYTISNAGYNSNILAGQSVSLGFTGGSGEKDAEPVAYKLFTYEINTIEYMELADGKMDKSYIENAIYPRLALQGLPIDDVRMADDYDKDGLTLIQEYEYDTNPFSTDTDEDGLNDYDEIYIYKTKPINSDTDNDGMSDGTEVSCGLNPLNSDTDGDGVADNEETVTQQVRLQTMLSYALSDVGTLPTVELTGQGDYSQQMYVQSVENDETLLDIDCLVGTAFDFVHEEDINFQSGKLTFNIDSEILKDNNIEDLAIAWYNEECNSLELLKTQCDADNNTISAEVEHFSIYMVVSATKYFDFISRGNVDSILKTGKADIIFVVDTSGSMGTEISNVRDNIEEFISILDENDVDVRLGLVEYKDIYYDGIYTTKSYNWYDDVSAFKNQLNALKVTGGGGDGAESLVDALDCVSDMKYRTGVDKYIIILTDESHKKGTASDANVTLAEQIDELKANDVCVSVVTSTSLFDDYAELTEETEGVLADINKKFSVAFTPIITNIGTQNSAGCWIRLSNGFSVKLDADPTLGNVNIDTDGDGIPDIIELGNEIKITSYNWKSWSIATVNTTFR